MALTTLLIMSIYEKKIIMDIGNHEMTQEKLVVGDLYIGPKRVLFNLKLSYHIYVVWLELSILKIYLL